MGISAKEVMKLRQQTGAGMMDCKQALKDTNGNFEEAAQLLREKGVADAAKRSDRATNNGYIAVEVSDDMKTGALVELNCETDFVARNNDFRAFADLLAKVAVAEKPDDVDALMKLQNPDRGLTLEDTLKELLSSIGENLSVNSLVVFDMKDPGLIGSYVHPGEMLATMVAISADNDDAGKKTEIQELARNIAMHIAATNPLALNADSLDPKVVEQEREVYKNQALNEGKKPEFVDKIIEGRLRKFYSENCLINQIYIRDESRKKSVKDVVGEVSKETGENLNITWFTRLQVGE